MKSEQFRLWVKSCEEFGQTIYRLESDGEDTGLYLTIKQYLWEEYNPYCDPAERGHYFYPEQYYHVWINGKEIDVIDDDRYTAYALYHNELKRARAETQSEPPITGEAYIEMKGTEKGNVMERKQA